MSAFQARIDGRRILCNLTPDRELADPVLCFSMMAPPRVLRGGRLTKGLGGHAELTLPDLRAGQAHEIVLEYADPEFRPVNRAWLPMGPYLRHAGGVTALPQPCAQGVNVGAPVPPAPVDGALGLCPPPTSWFPESGHADLRGGVNFAHEAAEVVEKIDVSCRLASMPFLSGQGLPVTLEMGSDQGPEGYRLDIAPEGITVVAGDRAGVLYAAVTLRHLQILHAGRIPCGRIADRPRFAWRGQHLDCARHFYSVPTILRLLELMALFKLNRFHWHFVDDEAFRPEIDCLPDLWRKTAFRGEGEVLPGLFGGGIRSGGSYSRQDIRTILEHAEKLNISVLPEIEVPAHALALTRAIPGLRDPDDTGQEVSVQGYVGNTINPALPRSWEVVDALAQEMAALFPMGMVHLGGDELPPGTWDGSPLAAALKRREGLETTDDLMGWTMARAAAPLAARGVRPAAWEEAARGSQGGIGHGALLFSWTGQGPGLDAARAGHDVVMSPAQHCYLDMAHTGAPDDWGAAWAAFVGLEDTVNWSPVPADAADIADRIAGVQGAYWSEFTTQDAQIWPMLMPRILGVAAKAWDRHEAVDGPALRALADGYRGAMQGFWQWNWRA